MHSTLTRTLILFQSTLPARGATYSIRMRLYDCNHFNPRSPHGERPPVPGAKPFLIYFNPRSPHGERQEGFSLFNHQVPFQSTLPARGATTCLQPPSNRLRYFNPRSPHGERQNAVFITSDTTIFQSTLPARGATGCKSAVLHWMQFQSTLPARGATYSIRMRLYDCNHFNPRSPHGERPPVPGAKPFLIYFNPRSPHGERQEGFSLFNHQVPFQSTLPARGATTCLQPPSNRLRYFNPRSPHGERQNAVFITSDTTIFQSTLPARGATGDDLLRVLLEQFQSTLPARGATLSFPGVCPS